MGPHIFNPTSETIAIRNPEQRDNRDRRVEFCINNNLVISNTFFDKPQHKLVTYRAPGTIDFETNLDCNKYA